VHPEVTADDEPALERQQEILAARLDALEALPVDSLGDSEEHRPRMSRLGFDHLALEQP
jgi:hypothetical protein